MVRVIRHRALRVGLLAVMLSLPLWGQPAAGDEAVQRGIQAYLTGNYAQAIAELQRGLDSGLQEYKPSRVWLMLGNSYCAAGDYEKAMNAHRQALELNPKCHLAWTNLGIAYRRLEKLKQAEDCYRKALGLKPDYPQLHASLGALYLCRKQPQKAEKSLLKAIKLDGQMATAHANLAVALAMQGRHEEAEQALEKALNLGYRHGSAVKNRLAELKK